MTERRDYELAPHLNRESCDEEEEYCLKYEGEEEEVPDLDQDYDMPTTPCTSQEHEVRPRNTSPSVFFNHGNINSGNSCQVLLMEPLIQQYHKYTEW